MDREQALRQLVALGRSGGDRIHPAASVIAVSKEITLRVTVTVDVEGMGDETTVPG